jgi:hypothetical protein
VSPICGDLRGLPPLLIYVGAAETLLDDSVRISAVAGAAGVRVTLDIWPDMIHAFSLFLPQLAVARQALAQVGEFVQAMTGGEWDDCEWLVHEAARSWYATRSSIRRRDPFAPWNFRLGANHPFRSAPKAVVGQWFSCFRKKRSSSLLASFYSRAIAAFQSELSP